MVPKFKECPFCTYLKNVQFRVLSLKSVNFYFFKLKKFTFVSKVS